MYVFTDQILYVGTDWNYCVNMFGLIVVSGYWIFTFSSLQLLFRNTIYSYYQCQLNININIFNNLNLHQQHQ